MLRHQRQSAGDESKDLLKSNNLQTNGADNIRGQPDESGKQDHASAEHPDRREPVSSQSQMSKRSELLSVRHNQNWAAGEWKTCQLARIGGLDVVKECSCAGEKGEGRRAEVRDPAGKEDSRIGFASRLARLDADMIDHH
jgi:hypothetical protein